MTEQNLKISLVKPFCTLNCNFDFLSLISDIELLWRRLGNVG
jgi:hypothetical protein